MSDIEKIINRFESLCKQNERRVHIVPASSNNPEFDDYVVFASHLKEIIKSMRKIYLNNVDGEGTK